MGLTQLVKHKITIVKRGNTTLPRSLKEATRRATSLAADIERSNDPEAEKKLEEAVNRLAENFDSSSQSDVLKAIAPIQHVKQKQAVLTFEATMDSIKPMKGRAEEVNKAITTDTKKYNGVINDLQFDTCSLDTLHSFLSLMGKENMSDATQWSPEFSQLIKDQNDEIYELHKLFEAFTTKTKELKAQGLIGENITVLVMRMEDGWNAEVKKFELDPDSTFSELFDKVDPNEAYDVPEFWIKTKDPTQNVVTKSGEVWEMQPQERRIQEALSRAVDTTGKTLRLSMVQHDGDYVVALVKDDTQERNHLIEMKSPVLPAKKYLAPHFCNKSIERVCKLNGNDVADKPFSKRHFQAKTNAVYVELVST